MSFNTIYIMDISYGTQSVESSPPTRPPTYKDASFVFLTGSFETFGYPEISMTVKNVNQNSYTTEYIVTGLDQDSYVTTQIVINGIPYSGELIMNPANSMDTSSSAVNAITGESLLTSSGSQQQGSGFTHSEYTFNILEYNSAGVAFKGGWSNQIFDVSVNIYNLAETSDSSGTSITLNYNIVIQWRSSTSADASFIPVSSVDGFQYIIVTSDSGNTTWTFTSNTEEYTYLTYYPTSNSIQYTLTNDQLLIFGWIGSIGGMVNYSSYTAIDSPIPFSSLIISYVNLINTLEYAPCMLSTLLSVNSNYNNNTYNSWQSNIDVSFNNVNNEYENSSANFFNYSTSSTGTQAISTNYVYSESSYDYSTSNGKVISYYLVYDVSYGPIYYKNGKEVNNTALDMSYSFAVDSASSGSFRGSNFSDGSIVNTIYDDQYLDISFNSLIDASGTTVYYYTKGFGVTYVNGTYTQDQAILSVSVNVTTGYDVSYVTISDPSGMYYQYSFSGTYSTSSSINQTIPLNAIRYLMNGTFSWQNDSTSSPSYIYLNLYLFFLGITSIVSAVNGGNNTLGGIGSVLTAPYLYNLYGISPTLNVS